MDEIADRSCISSGLLSSGGLPQRLVGKATHAFQLLDCNEPVIEALVATLVAFVELHDAADPIAIRRILSLIVAANHTICRLSGPGLPMATEPSDAILTSSEWLLLASRERMHAPLTHDLKQAIDNVVSQLDEASTFDLAVLASEQSPIVDYGFGKLLAAATGKSSAPDVVRAGHALGKLTRLSLEVLLATRPCAHFLAPIVLRCVVASNDDLEARLQLAVALACKPAPDKLPLVSFVGHQTVRARIIAACESWMTDSTRGFDGRELEVARALASMTSQLIEQTTRNVQLFGFSKPPSLVAELDRTIDLAVDALLADPELRESWEVQRWGGRFPHTCVGRFFPVGLCTLALAAASIDPTGRAGWLLSLRCADGFRYFEGFDGIAPDSDDLGLALQLAARMPRDDARIESFAWPVEVLVKNTTLEGEIPVWLEQHLREPLKLDAPKWRGSRCLAVASNAVIGLIESGVPVPPSFIDRAIAWITRTWRADGMRAVFFYGLPYARFLLARLGDVADGRTEDPAVYDELRAIVTDVEDAIIASRNLDGGFGGIIDSACHLAALACGRRKPFDPWPTVAFLASRQEHDGLWPSEPLYPTPGKDDAPGAHGTRSITSALCLYALATTRKRLAQG